MHPLYKMLLEHPRTRFLVALQRHQQQTARHSRAWWRGYLGERTLLNMRARVAAPPNPIKENDCE